MRHARELFHAVAAVAFLSHGPVASAQALRSVQSKPPCPDCSILVTKVVSLGNNTGGPGEIIGTLSRLDSDVRGSYYLSFNEPGQLISVFDSDGSFLTDLGREGDGPGEYRKARVAAVTKDSIFITDLVSARLTVVELTQLGKPARTVTVPEFTSMPVQTLRLPSGMLVAHMLLRTPEAIGYPIHLFDPSGRLLRSTGIETPAYRPDRLALFGRRLATSRSGGFWVAHVTTPVFEEYDSEGEVRQSLRVNLPSLPEWDPTAPPPHPKGSPPKAQIMAIHQASDGLLWVAVAVPDPEWRSAFSTTRRKPSSWAPDGFVYQVEDYSDLLDTELVVLDPEKQVILASLRIDLAVTSFDGRGYAAGTRTHSPTGVHQVEVIQLRLVR
jgi:hypothetical protein